MNPNFDLLNEIVVVKGTNAKIELLQQAVKHDDTRQFLNILYNDDIYGMADTSINKIIDIPNRLFTERKTFPEQIEFMKSLVGNNKIDSLGDFFAHHNKNERIWYSRAILKDFPSVGIKTYNKALKNKGYETLPEFDLQYCESVILDTEMNVLDWNGVKTDEKNQVQHKYDGCLNWNSDIYTDKGILKISDIVKNKIQCNVLSYNEINKKFEYKKIINWFDNGYTNNSEDWLVIDIGKTKSLKVTKNHKIFTDDGWQSADNLNNIYHKVMINVLSKEQIGILLGFILGDGNISFDNKKSYRLRLSSISKDNIDFKINILGYNNFTMPKEHISGYSNNIVYNLNINKLQKTNFNILEFYNINSKNREISFDTMKKYFNYETLSIWFSDDGSLSYNNGNEETPLMTLNTHRYNKEQINIFVKFFEEVYNMKPSVYKDNRVSSTNGEYIRFNTNDSKILFDKISHYMVKGTEYKYPIKNNYIERKNMDCEFVNFDIKKFNPQNLNFEFKENFHKYDIEVEDNHNYVADGILVHNCRLYIKKKGNNFAFISRNNKEFFSLNILKEVLMGMFPNDDFIFDGEVISPEGYNELMKKLKRNAQMNISDFKYQIFDVIKFNDRDFTSETQINRYNWLESNINDKRGVIEIAETFLTTSSTSIEEIFQDVVYSGGEGVIIKPLDGLYEYGSRKYWWKMKPVYEGTFEIVDVELGSGKNRGKISALWIKDKYESIKCKVGSGLTEKDVDFLTEKGKEWIIGKFVDIWYNEILINGLRFPRFKAPNSKEEMNLRIRDDKEEADDLIPLRTKFDNIRQETKEKKFTSNIETQKDIDW